jgi:hypothetical protein
MAIRAVNWGELQDVRPVWLPEGWGLWGIWPSPVDHDVCFQEAGFDDFADSDGEWDSGFALLVEDVLGVLGALGVARLIEGEYPTERGRMRKTFCDALVAAARDDNFAPCVVVFGEPARGFIRTSNGHPILWLVLADAGAAEVREKLGARHEVREGSLRWDKLV